MDYNIFEAVHEQQSSTSDMDLSEEDNDPFVGTHHLYASGIGTTIGEARLHRLCHLARHIPLLLALPEHLRHLQPLLMP